NVLSDLGVAAGDRVAVQTEKHLDCIWLYLACLRLGAVYLPLNTAYTGAEVKYFVSDADPRLFVHEAGAPTDESLAPALAGRAVETLDRTGTGSLQHRAAAAAQAFPTRAVSGDDLAAILYTSGTTGRSKGAMI